MSLSSVERSVKEAERADYKMSVWLPFLPTIFMIIGFLSIMLGGFSGSTGGIAAGLSFGFLIFILAVILNFYVLYKWIYRRNEHFKRTVLLYESVANYLDSEEYKDEATRLRDETRRMELHQGGEKNAVLWMVLGALVPLVIFYIYHFLNKDFVNHDREESLILGHIDHVLKGSGLEGLNLGFTSIGKFPERNTVIYFILSLITLGFFSLYWVYVLTKDPNVHFDGHRIVEAKLLDELRQLAGRTA